MKPRKVLGIFRGRTTRPALDFGPDSLAGVTCGECGGERVEPVEFLPEVWRLECSHCGSAGPFVTYRPERP